MRHQKYNLATEEELETGKAFSEWWTWFRVAHQLNTVPGHIELAIRIASQESWIAAQKYSTSAKEQQ